jgi:hypothetical protein
MKLGWCPELDGLLESFEALQGLVVRESSLPGERVAARVASLAPEQLGLDGRVAAGGEWGGEWDLFRGGLFYAANMLGEAHALFQEVGSCEGSYWHGMLHRREGDFSNALYWIRRAGPIPALSGIADFSPAAFVSDCAAAAGRGVEPPHLLEMQRREWTAMMGWSWRRLEKLG